MDDFSDYGLFELVYFENIMANSEHFNPREYFEHIQNLRFVDPTFADGKALSNLYRFTQLDRFEQADIINKMTNLEESCENLDNSNKSSSSSDWYEIKDNRKNLCLVYNDVRRKGSEFDVKKIEDTFKKIGGFTVKCEEIQSKDVLLRSLEQHINCNSLNSDMIICFFMAHGDKDLIYDKQGNEIYENELRELFSGKNAPTLINKPKVLIFQSCRGNRSNRVIEFDHPQKTPELSDFFFIYSTLEGFHSYRNTIKGSWFIQTFCDLVQTHSKQKHLDKICTSINRTWSDLEDVKEFTQICEVKKSLRKDKIYLEKPLK